MAKANPANLLSLSQNFFARLIFGLVLTLIFLSAGQKPAPSIFLGILGGLALGWMTSATKNSAQIQSGATSDGIDAGLKYLLAFMLGFVVLGYPTPSSVLLGGLAGLAGGWIIAWWKTKEETKNQLSSEVTEVESSDIGEERISQKIRRPVHRYRKRSGTSAGNFWERF
jgi:uncharacterized membrane protein YjjB (DUF3815 family)